jgi:hypothetical protein
MTRIGERQMRVETRKHLGNAGGIRAEKLAAETWNVATVGADALHVMERGAVVKRN